MLARLFSRSRVNHSIILPGLAILLTSWYLFWTPLQPIEFYFLGEPCILAPFIAYPLAVLLILASAFLLQHIAKLYGFVQDHFYLPPLMVMLYMLFFFENGFLAFAQGLFFFTILFSLFIKSGERNRPSFAIFDLGLLIGVLMLFHFSYVFLLVFCWAGLIIFGFSPWRSVLLTALGSVTTWFLLVTALRTLSIFYAGIDYIFMEPVIKIGTGLLEANNYYSMAVHGFFLLLVLPEIWRTSSRASVARRQLGTLALIIIVLTVAGLLFIDHSQLFFAPLFTFCMLFMSNLIAYSRPRYREIGMYALLSISILTPVILHYAAV
jgi:hypothetical protein